MTNMRILSLVAFAMLALVAPNAYTQESRDLDAYKWRIDADWWFSRPTGFFEGKNKSGEFDLNKDLGFGSYSTFAGQLDWHFKRKHHLLFVFAPVSFEKTHTLTRTIDFEGKTFDVGVTVDNKIDSESYGPGYQYDMFRRHSWYLALVTQFNLLSTGARLTVTRSVNGETPTGTTASGSFFAPLPIIGPRALWYPIHNSTRLSLDGSALGMYFFGYGDFVRAKGAAYVSISKHWRAEGGYQMGTRLSIHGGSSNIGIRLTQKGATAGIRASW